MRVLGIDPGLQKTGWAILEQAPHATTPTHIASGLIRTHSHMPMEERLAYLAARLQKVIQDHQPERGAIERVFVNINPQSTLLLGQARGALMTACGLARIPLEEFTPLEIKQAVTCHGRASKERIQKMVHFYFPDLQFTSSDQSDAIACALCLLQRVKTITIEQMGYTSRTYGTARRGNARRSSRQAWSDLLDKQGKL